MYASASMAQIASLSQQEAPHQTSRSRWVDDPLDRPAGVAEYDPQVVPGLGVGRVDLEHRPERRLQLGRRGVLGQEHVRPRHPQPHAVRGSRPARRRPPLPRQDRCERGVTARPGRLPRTPVPRRAASPRARCDQPSPSRFPVPTRDPQSAGRGPPPCRTPVGCHPRGADHMPPIFTPVRATASPCPVSFSEFGPVAPTAGLTRSSPGSRCSP